MSGILANSASKSMLSGTEDNAVSGYVSLESVTLATTETHSSYQWSLAKPSASSGRSSLSSTTDPNPTFTPDAEGYFTVACLVDGTTTFILRIGVVAAAGVTTIGAIRLMPLADAQVPAPPTGASIYFSSDAGALVEKLSDGTVHRITVS